jgi:hypothetical protein
MAVDQQVLNQLKHEDPKERRKAIVALANSRDQAALAALTEVSRIDDDSKLRQLAAKAVQHIREQTERMASGARGVSERDQERAKSYTDEALGLYIAKDLAKATRALAKALQANPNLKTDMYFLSLVGNVFNTSGEEGLALLTSGEKRSEFIRSSEQGQVQKRKDEHRAATQEIGWGSLGFDLTVYGLVWAVVTFLYPLVGTQLLGRLATTAKTAAASASGPDPSLEFTRSFAQFNKAIATVGIPVFLIAALIVGVVMVVSMLIQGGFIHLAARLLGGTGTMPNMMSKLVPFYSLMTGVFFIWFCIAMGLISVGAGIIGLLCMAPMALVSFYVLFQSAGRIAKAYDFGVGQGCLTLIISSFLLGLLSALPSILLQGALTQWLTNALASGRPL